MTLPPPLRLLFPEPQLLGTLSFVLWVLTPGSLSKWDLQATGRSAAHSPHPPGLLSQTPGGPRGRHGGSRANGEAPTSTTRALNGSGRQAQGREHLGPWSTAKCTELVEGAFRASQEWGLTRCAYPSPARTQPTCRRVDATRTPGPCCLSADSSSPSHSIYHFLQLVI